MSLRSSLVLRALAGCLFVSISSVSLADLSLFQDDNFRGREFRASDEVANLKDVGVNDEASSVIIDRGHWQVCTDAGFRGRCESLAPGRYSSLRAMGLNDQISSIRPDPQAHGSGHDDAHGRDAIVLFQHDNFSGEALPLDMNESDLKTRGFNDRASSVIVNYGQWEICSDANFQGRCETLDPGRYASMRALNLNDAVSSIRRVGRGAGPRSGAGTGGYNSRQQNYPPGDGIPPQVLVSRNGVGEVFFTENRCVVYYDKNGRRMSNATPCSGAQIERADDAMDDYRRSHGL